NENPTTIPIVCCRIGALIILILKIIKYLILMKLHNNNTSSSSQLPLRLMKNISLPISKSLLQNPTSLCKPHQTIEYSNTANFQNDNDQQNIGPLDQELFNFEQDILKDNNYSSIVFDLKKIRNSSNDTSSVLCTPVHLSIITDYQLREPILDKINPEKQTEKVQETNQLQSIIQMTESYCDTDKNLQTTQVISSDDPHNTEEVADEYNSMEIDTDLNRVDSTTFLSSTTGNTSNVNIDDIPGVQRDTDASISFLDTTTSTSGSTIAIKSKLDRQNKHLDIGISLISSEVHEGDFNVKLVFMGVWFATKNLKGIVSLTNGYLNGRPENGTQQQKHFASALAKYGIDFTDFDQSFKKEKAESLPRTLDVSDIKQSS
ncbi:unnamed protein product, partial [Rotaria sordida]